MTICLAVLCDDSHKVVVAADRGDKQEYVIRGVYFQAELEDWAHWANARFRLFVDGEDHHNGAFVSAVTEPPFVVPGTKLTRTGYVLPFSVLVPVGKSFGVEVAGAPPAEHPMWMTFAGTAQLEPLEPRLSKKDQKLVDDLDRKLAVKGRRLKARKRRLK